MIISVCNEKGGSGKTTIALNIAVKLGLLKEDTLLIDADPQRSIEVFTNIRANELILFLILFLNLEVALVKK